MGIGVKADKHCMAEPELKSVILKCVSWVVPVTAMFLICSLRSWGSLKVKSVVIAQETCPAASLSLPGDKPCPRNTSTRYMFVYLFFPAPFARPGPWGMKCMAQCWHQVHDQYLIVGNGKSDA